VEGGGSDERHPPTSPLAASNITTEELRKAGPDPDFWSRTAPTRAASTLDDRSEVMSQSGMTDVASVADSQRSEFTMRNRTGHGNILTWGSDSRSITPHKKRQGRQMTLDHDRGVPRSHMSSVGHVFQHERR